jgi:prepilin-type N-terminal cleavage/methylation domain-containing protein
MSYTVITHGTASRAARRGFTLIEAMMVTVIIGVGVMSMLQLLATGTMANGESTELTTAVQLANNINELCVRTKYQNLRTAVATSAGRLYDPPIDGRGQPLVGYGGWTQFVTVVYVEPHRLTVAVPDSQVEPTSRVSVEIRRNGKAVYSTSSVVAAAQWPPLP